MSLNFLEPTSDGVSIVKAQVSGFVPGEAGYEPVLDPGPEPELLALS